MIIVWGVYLVKRFGFLLRLSAVVECGVTWGAAAGR